MKKLLALTSILSLMALTVVPAFAVASPTEITIDTPAEVKITDIGPLISASISLILIIAGIAAFFYLVFGGIQWITSGGDKAGTEAAREKITAAIIGLVIVAASYALIRIAETFLGINIFSASITIPKAY